MENVSTENSAEEKPKRRKPKTPKPIVVDPPLQNPIDEKKGKIISNPNDRGSFLDTLDQIKAPQETIELETNETSAENDLGLLQELDQALSGETKQTRTEMIQRLGFLAAQMSELRQQEVTEANKAKINSQMKKFEKEQKKLNSTLHEIDKDRAPYVKEQISKKTKEKVQPSTPPKSKKEKVETSVNQPQPENTTSSLDSEIAQIRSEIKEYEETIKAIEYGEKFAVPGAKVEDFHKKIVEAENRLKKIENSKIETKQQEEQEPEVVKESATLEVPGLPVFNETNTSWILNYTFGEQVEKTPTPTPSKKESLKTPDATKTPEQAPQQERKETSAEKIKNVKSFEELFAVLNKMGGIMGSTVFFGSEKIIRLIQEVRDGKKSARCITPSEGLKAKVIELLDLENNPNKEEAQTNPEQKIPEAEKVNDKENKQESEYQDVEVVPELTPEEFLERQKKIEALYAGLEDTRKTFIVEYHKYLKERRHSGAIAWIKSKLGIAKQEDESQLPESLNGARELYDKSKMAYAQELRTQLHERGATLAEINVEIYDRIILDEYALRKRAEVELWTPKEKGTIRKSLDWYMKQNRFVRVGISSAILTGAIAATGGLGAVAGSAVFAGRYVRGIISVTTGQLAGVGFDKVFKDKTGERLENSIQEQREDASDIYSPVKEPLQQLHDMEKRLEETYSKSEADKRKRLLAKSAVMLAATLGANAGLKQLEELYQPTTPIVPKPISESTSGPEPIPPTTPDITPIGGENIVDTTSVEEIQPINPFEVSSTSVTITSDANNLWSAIKVKLQAEGLLSHLGTSGQQTHMVDQVYNVFEKMTPEQLKAIGIVSGDVQRVMTGSTIDLSSVFGKPEMLESMFGGSNELAQQAISNIEAQGRIISAFQAANPKVMLTPELIKQIVTRAGL